uniref:Uncharacterized protein n=1 Tax=Salvator merianae TaxID=96440 RepID=A0A8D0BRT7_SALMN
GRFYGKRSQANGNSQTGQGAASSKFRGVNTGDPKAVSSQHSLSCAVLEQNSQALFYYSLPFSVPWQVQYFVPLTDAEFRERLARHKGEITIMLRSSDFNQDKTALIETNNPFPLLISGQHLSVPLQYFPKDVLGRVGWASFLSMLKMKNLGYQGSEKSQIETSEGSQSDFQTEAHFSKCYAEKRLQKLYPHLRMHMVPDTKKIEPLPSIQGWSATASQWEPLTISCLTETKPTVLVPGEDGFRYGSAPLWIVNNSMVTKHSK